MPRRVTNEARLLLTCIFGSAAGTSVLRSTGDASDRPNCHFRDYWHLVAQGLALMTDQCAEVCYQKRNEDGNACGQRIRIPIGPWPLLNGHPILNVNATASLLGDTGASE